MNASPPAGAPRERSGAASSGDRRLARRLEALTRASRLALFWERLWPALWPLLGVVLLFIATALSGLFMAAPQLLSAIIRIAFAAAALAALWPLARLRWPSREEALARLDRSAPDLSSARIASAWFDDQATGLDDPLSRALWLRRREELRQRLGRLRLRAPRIPMADHDRYALRAIPVLAVAVAAFVAGPDWRQRLTPAFRLDFSLPEAGARRLDGWIDPPRYTRRPPLMLNFTGPSAGPLRVPVNSMLVLQAAGGGDLRVNAGAGLTPVTDEPDAGKTSAGRSAPAPAPGLQRARYRITGDASVTVRAGGESRSFTIEAIPDAPPKVALKGRPAGGARGSLAISYTATDDYGLASGVAEIRLPGGGPGRSLAAPPQIRLNLPANPADGAELKTVAELASHPWAGAEVDLTLLVKDDAGQEGRSETVRITLPERTFADPLARALVEQRRDLILTPDLRERVQTALDALMIAPELFTPRAGYYLGLRRVTETLRAAKNDDDLRDAAEQMWELALVVEDGDLSDAERQLRQAQQALRDAIERGADAEEISRLSRELRQAMDRYMAEMSRQARARPQRKADPNATNITQDDLQKLLDRIEELTREGRREEAARLLDRLREIMENLQMAQPAQGGQGTGQQGGEEGQQGETGQRLGRALNQLDELMREQQALRDDTFRQGQQAGREPGEDGEDEAGGAPGDQPSGTQQPGRQSNDGRRGDKGPAHQRDGQGGAPGQPRGPRDGAGPGDLGQRQEALRRRLDALKDQLKRDGAEISKGLGEAGEDMKGAGEALQRDSHGEAVDAQGRALDQLRRGAQDLARQMAEADGKGREGAGQAGREGEKDGEKGGARAGSGPETDPLGRPMRGADRGLGRLESGEAGEAAGARARRILDELRRRLGERQRDREELDYLERLLTPPGETR